MLSIPLFFSFGLFKKSYQSAKKYIYIYNFKSLIIDMYPSRFLFIMLLLLNIYFMAAVIHFIIYLYIIPQNHIEIRLAVQNMQGLFLYILIYYHILYTLYRFQATVLNTASVHTQNLCTHNLSHIISLVSLIYILSFSYFLYS